MILVRVSAATLEPAEMLSGPCTPRTPLLHAVYQVHVYFKRFDDAEDLYRQIDRLDLAIALRSRLGAVLDLVCWSSSQSANMLPL